MTNGWIDIKNTDMMLIMGGNPAENHPCGFKWAIEAKIHRNAKTIVVDPRLTRTAANADLYLQIRAGADIAFLGGLINYAIENNRIAHDYLVNYTNAAFIIKEGFKLPEDGLYSGFDPSTHEYDKSTWNYEAAGSSGRGNAPAALPPNVAYDVTLAHSRSVFQLLKQHYSRYTPEMVERITGIARDQFLKAADLFTSVRKDGDMKKVSTIIYAVGWTQHSFGTQIIRTAAMLQLLLGNVGRAGGGVNALRGHSNIQGATDMAGVFDILPGYLKMPNPTDTDFAAYLKRITPTAAKPDPWDSFNYWSNTPKFATSFLKAMYGPAATKDNDWAFNYLPKIDRNYSWVNIWNDMYEGKIKGIFAFGMNGVMIGPDSQKNIDALKKADWLVVCEIYPDETSEFWRAPGITPEEMKKINGKALADLTDPKTSQTIKAGQQLPGFAWLKDDGTTLSGNWLYCGSWTEAGAMIQRRGTDDPSGLGIYPNWAWSWPANRRVLYNRASCDLNGKPWDPSRRQVWWDETKQSWVGNDVPDFKADSPPKDHMGPFIMNPEGVGRIFVPLGAMADGPFPEHYEPIESPIANPLHPNQSNNPVVKRYKTDLDKYANSAQEYNIVCTTYRLTEHYHYWTKNNPMNVQLVPEPFVEIPVELADRMGIRGGERVKVSSIRSHYIAKAMVTRRIRPMKIDGKETFQIGIPIHWGFRGIAEDEGKTAKTLANQLTPTVIDPNAYTPEFKGFLVKIEKA